MTYDIRALEHLDLYINCIMIDRERDNFKLGIIGIFCFVDFQRGLHTILRSEKLSMLLTFLYHPKAF
jgi:hypothetical protein